MELGTKAYYRNAFKNVLMTNLITNESTSLSSAHINYEKIIAEAYASNSETRALLLGNLQKAYDEIVHELVGVADE